MAQALLKNPTLFKCYHLDMSTSSKLDVMNGFIFASEFAENEILACQKRESNFPGVETLETFLENLCILVISCVVMGGASHPIPIQSLYSKPVKKLLAEYLANHPPPAALSWLNLYLGKGKDQVQNLLHG